MPSTRSGQCLPGIAVWSTARHQALADQLGLDAESVLTCSTGVIGVRFRCPLCWLAGSSVEALDDNGGMRSFNAILTTDLVPKQVALNWAKGRRVRIGGMAKGSGMIHPDCHTMLGFFSCDAGLEADVGRRWKKRGAAFLQCHHGGWRHQHQRHRAGLCGRSSTERSTTPFWSRPDQAMQQLAQATEMVRATCLMTCKLRVP